LNDTFKLYALDNPLLDARLLAITLIPDRQWRSSSFQYSGIRSSCLIV